MVHLGRYGRKLVMSNTELKTDRLHSRLWLETHGFFCCRLGRALTFVLTKATLGIDRTEMLETKNKTKTNEKIESHCSNYGTPIVTHCTHVCTFEWWWESCAITNLDIAHGDHLVFGFLLLSHRFGRHINFETAMGNVLLHVVLCFVIAGNLCTQTDKVSSRVGPRL